MEQKRRIYHLLNQAQHQLKLYIDKTMVETAGVTGAQVAALLYLEKHDGCQQKELAAGLKLDTSAITGMVERLCRKALVEKRRSEADRRAFSLHLSEAGRLALAQVKPVIRTNNQLLEERFGRESLDQFCDILQFLADIKTN
ncbi:MarR family winged helix-turn-helix transcriptional regulator [Aestuariirhabdus sp. Z084]|uniref:MarR family winged helix-turn-helix transcriptional regulator n=1 Tax=Aestuariirhabdus haliotis TaxID=2918751 RepID=UPI00201B402C|nr:MarR family winged helix-turn-helix transcriptional regulator [Aestuariirhabdus haliotis]MCL6414314.1 MarR family winged helix-turn-helix transcriptional regulator [Aestuariirhabdus haliotis]MCL6418246.1 MarR family winged helix-turn-helix transcriptional regulator [Aestuariirhabdus haliotis]